MSTERTGASRRVLFVDHAAVLGGGELSLLDIAIAFRGRGAVALFEDGPFAHALVSRNVAVMLIAAGSALRKVKKSSSISGFSALGTTVMTAIELARSARAFDVLYANSPKSFIISALAGLLARRPVIWHLRDLISPEHFSRTNIRLLVTVANMRAACVIANSQATADAFIAAGARPELMRVVHCGIDAGPFDALPAETRARVRDSLGIPGDAFLVGSFSRLHPWKGQRVLMDALDEIPDVQAIVVGGALFSGEEPYEEELRARADRAPLAGRVRMLGTRDDVPELMAACDVVVHTSTLPEPFGRVLVEALLLRRPLVATNAGGVREIVVDQQSALLVPPGDAGALVSAIQTIRANPTASSQMAEVGSVHVRRHFTHRTMVAGVEAALDEVFQRTGT